MFKSSKKIFNNKKGVALLYALITISVLLVITGSMAGLIIKETKMSTSVDISTKAYAAAESGIAHGDFLLATPDTGDENVVIALGEGGITKEIDGPDLTYTLSISVDGADADSHIITSTGKSGNSARRIEKKVNSSDSAQPFIRAYKDNPDLISDSALTYSEHSIKWLDEEPGVAPNIKMPVDSSYKQLFKLETGAILGDFAIGLTEDEFNFSGDTSDKIMLVQKGENIALFSGNRTEMDYPNLEDEGITLDPNTEYYIELQQKSNLAVQARILEGSKGGTCVAVLSIPLTGDFELWNVRFENASSWGGGIDDDGTDTVDTSVNGVSVSYMGIKTEVVDATTYPPDPEPPSSSWFNASWTKRAPVTIGNTGNPSVLTNYQTSLTVPYDADMKSDFSDLRFTDTDGVTLLDYWVEKYTASSSATVWIETPSIAASSNKTIYMYYRNAGASSLSNGNNTFPYFEDFESATVGATPPGWTLSKHCTDDGTWGTLNSCPSASFPYSANGDNARYFENGRSMKVRVATTKPDLYDNIYSYATTDNLGFDPQGYSVTAWINSNASINIPQHTHHINMHYGIDTNYAANTQIGYCHVDVPSAPCNPTTGSGYNESKTGADGRTWYRYTNNWGSGAGTSYNLRIGARARKWQWGTIETTYWVDEIRMQKTASPAPSTTIGAEENQ